MTVDQASVLDTVRPVRLNDSMRSGGQAQTDGLCKTQDDFLEPALALPVSDMIDAHPLISPPDGITSP